MKRIPFDHARYVMSVLAEADLPLLRDKEGAVLPEIAIVGRSNVGKSSLINHLLKRKELAFVSAKPGKTQTLNFFVIDERLSFVDLPGYGYAKADHVLRKKWAESIHNYLTSRPTLKSILFLIDSRRLPTEEDCAFVEWALHHGLSFLMIFTKVDKLKPAEIERNVANSLAILKKRAKGAPLDFLYYSIKSGRSRIELIEKINELFK